MIAARSSLPSWKMTSTFQKTTLALIQKIFFLASQSSSIGEDVILRCVIGGINSAKQSISICMGHFNVLLLVAKALQAATEPGVKVSVLTNSLYSCDLRGGQRDLFLWLGQLLALAPNIDLVRLEALEDEHWR